MFSKQRKTRTKFKLIDSSWKCDLLKNNLIFRPIPSGFGRHFVFVRLSWNTSDDSGANFRRQQTARRGWNNDRIARERQRRIRKTKTFHLMAKWVESLSGYHSNHKVIHLKNCRPPVAFYIVLWIFCQGSCEIGNFRSMKNHAWLMRRIVSKRKTFTQTEKIWLAMKN